MGETTSNREYKDWVAGVFDRSSAAYDRVGPRFFTYFGRGLVEYADIQPGSRVLDVACGRGAVLIPASANTGGSGEVIGIDISHGMVKRLAAALKRYNIRNSTIMVMDAENLQSLDSPFDYVLCGLALFFFPDLGVALKEFFRVLKPEGYFVASTLAGAETPWQESLSKVTRSYQEKLAPAPLAETKDLSRQEEIEEEFKSAGFVGIEHMCDTSQFHYRDEAEWWEAEWSIFRRGFMERLDSRSLGEYRREVMDVVRERKTDEGIPTTLSVRYSRARKPAVPGHDPRPHSVALWPHASPGSSSA